MSSFEEKYYLGDAGLLRRLGRDLRLIQESLAFLLVWAVRGRKLRRDWHQAKKDNSAIILDDLMEKD